MIHYVPRITGSADNSNKAEVFREQYTAMRMRIQGSAPLLRLSP